MTETQELLKRCYLSEIKKKTHYILNSSLVVSCWLNPEDLVIVSPNITLFPVWEDEFSQVRLICILSNFFPNKLSVTWYQNQKPVTDIQPTKITLQSDGRPTYFTVITEIEPNMEEWRKGSSFACKAVHNSTEFQKTTSICKFYGSSAPSIHVEIPTFETVMTETKVKATCLSRKVFDAELTWLMDEKPPANDDVSSRSNATFLISELTVPSSSWKNLKTLKCKAEHRCFSAEKAVQVSGPAATTPHVEIRRAFPDLQKGDNVVLQCDVTQLSSQYLSVTFQDKGVHMAETQYIDLPDGPGPHSVSRSLTVPKTYWTNDSSFTCSVEQGFSSSPFESKSISSLFGSSSVEILLKPSEESGQQLFCSGWGLNPSIKWLADSKPLTPLINDVSMDKNGRVVVTSQLRVPQKDWKMGKVFICEVSDSSLNKNIRKNISVCTVTPAFSQKVGVYIRGPPLEQLQNERQLTVTCLFVGTGLSDFSIAWRVGANKASTHNVRTQQPVGHSNGTETLESSFIVSVEDWNSYKTVFCKAKHRCSSRGYDGSVSKSRDMRPPAVTIVRPTSSELLESDSFMLTCLVSRFFPANILVQWAENGKNLPSSRYINSPLWNEPGKKFYSMTSKLNVTRAEDKKSTYACIVRHESSETPVETSVKDVFASVTYSKPSAVLLQGSHELVCLVYGFSPASVNITWFRDANDELKDYNTTQPHLSADGKFSIRSHLRVSEMDSLPGVVLTCKVTHENTILSLNLSIPDTMEKCHVFDEIKHADVNQDTLQQTWIVAFTFLLFFLFSAMFSVIVIIIKNK